MRCIRLLWLACLWLLAMPAHALPAYARQTGAVCSACHLGFAELTPQGRSFKLSGYTLGGARNFPLDAVLTASATRVDTQGNDAAYPRQGEGVVEGGSVFVAGKLNDHAGLFSQWTYSDLNGSQQPDGSYAMFGNTSADNNDFRLVDLLDNDDLALRYGLSINNNPTVQDAWNSAPAQSYPYQTPSLLGLWGIAPPATLLEGGLAQQVMGLTAYGWLNNNWYLELGDYRYAAGPLVFFRLGTQVINRLHGDNPYLRLAYSLDWGANSLELGLFSLEAKVSIDPDNGDQPADHYRDQGADMQYQWLSEPHAITTQAYWIHEVAHWDASHLGVDHQLPDNMLDSLRWKASYWYERRYGLTLGYFSVHGSGDNIAYPVTGSPDTHGYTAEVDYMIQPGWLLGLQYTGYLKYQGASANYDGNGRNASSNNSTYLYTSIAF